MKIFVCEYITGGGLYRQPLPDSLAREGCMMRDALLRDLADVPSLVLTVTCDARITRPEGDINCIPVEQGDEVDKLWDAAIRSADAVWLIAPETDGVLSALSARVQRLGVRLLGTDPAVVDLFTDKFRAGQALLTAGLPAIPTYRCHTWPQRTQGAWVVKPDDGAGCEGVNHFLTTEALQAWLASHADPHLVVQPYIHGTPASLSILCRDGRGWLLAANRQHVRIEGGRFHYAGSLVNGLADHWPALESLAKRLAAAFPGLCGYVGVDVVVSESGLHVVEINPRLTTSYVGLRASIGANPARLIMDLLYNDDFEATGFDMPEHLTRRAIEVVP